MMNPVLFGCVSVNKKKPKKAVPVTIGKVDFKWNIPKPIKPKPNACPSCCLPMEKMTTKQGVKVLSCQNKECGSYGSQYMRK